MSVKAVTGAQLAVGSFSASGSVNGGAWGVEYGADDVTTLADEFAQHRLTIGTLQVAFTGFNDYAASGWAEYARSNWGSAQIVTLAYDTAAVGTGAVIANGLMPASRTFYATSGGVPAIAPTIVGSTVYPPFGEGLVTQAAASSITATGTTTAVEVGDLASTQYVLAAVHVLSYSGTGTLTFQLESAATSGGSYTARGSAGSAIGAVGSQWLSATGITTTDTFWRLSVTASASPVASVLASVAIFTP